MSHLQDIRNHEIAQVQALMPPGSHVLELGSGAGWQAERLARSGYKVTAIDVPSSNYLQMRVFPTVHYDGVHLPFPSQTFDVVFSSNVLEHVAPLPALLAETRRILKPEGVVIHVLPTPSWRFWTAGTHYLALMQRIGQYGPRSLLFSLWQARHGERGNLFTEFYYFGRTFWENTFKENGWTVSEYLTNQLFYTGYSFFDARLSMRHRRELSKYLGSACGIYILKVAKDNGVARGN